MRLLGRDWRFQLGPIIIGWLLAAAIVPMTALAQDPLVAIRNAAVIPSEQIRLKDIADPLPSLPKASWVQLGETILWPTPSKAEGPVVIQGARFQILLKQVLGLVAEACVVPPSVTIQRGGKVYLAAALQARVVEVLTPRVSGWGEEVIWRDYRVPQAIFLAEESDLLDVDGPTKLQPGRNTLRFVVKNATGKTLKYIAGSVFIDVWKTVPIAARPLARNEVIGPTEVAFGRKNLAFLRGEVWDGKKTGVRVRSSLGTDEVIYKSNIEVVPLIRKGDQVTLVFLREKLELKVPAKAMKDAGIGESITVQNLQSRKQILARVLDGQTVAVQ